MYVVVLFAGLLIYLGVMMAFLNSRAFSLFHPFLLYALFHGLVFVIRPFFSVWLDYEMIYNTYQFTPSLSDRITVIVAANLGFLSFAFFCFRHGHVEMRFNDDPLIAEERVRLTRYFPWVLMLMLPPALFSFATHFGAIVDENAYSNVAFDRTTGVFYNTSGNGYFAEAQTMLVPLTALVAWVFRFRLVAMIPLGMFILLRASTGGRGPFVAAMFSIGLFFLYHQRKKFTTPRVTVALVMAAAMFVVIGQDRGGALRAQLTGDTEYLAAADKQERFMEGMDLGNMEFFEFLVYVVPQRSKTYTYFNSVLQLFTEPIPRVLWPGKPFGPPFQTFSIYDYGYPIGMTRSLPGEGWISLGWIGVVVWCGFWGYMLGLIYRRFVESDQNTFKVAAYLTFLPILIVAYRDGTIVTVFRQGIFYMAPIGAWMLIARFFNVPRASDIRAILARRGRDEGDQQSPEPADQGADLLPARQLAELPPAVRRRRLALAEQRGG